jgi:hypothetical protein
MIEPERAGKRPKTDKRRRKRKYSRKPLTAKDKEEMWDNRFATEFSTLNNNLHPYYRQYFGK